MGVTTRRVAQCDVEGSLDCSTLRRASTKGGPRTVRAESMLEYDFFCVLDFDSRVETYKEQPVVIPWRTPEGQYRRYTPDVLVKFVSSAYMRDMNHLRSTIFEVKPYEVLKANWEKLRPKVRGVQASLEGTYVPFKILTERQLRPAFLKNVKFLLNYDRSRLVHNHRFTEAQAARLTAVTDSISDRFPMTPKEILDDITLDATERSYLVPWIWQCLRSGTLQADLIEPLTMMTEVWTRRCDHPTAKWMTPEYDWYR